MREKGGRSKVRSDGGIGIKGLWIRIKRHISENILLQALPYTIFISSLTFIGLFGGFAIGNGLGGGIAGFFFAFSFSMLGFFAGLLVSYTIVKIRYSTEV